MRKNVFGKQLSRDANERKALFKTLASSLVMTERIETTEAKAKAIRPYVEKLVTKAKRRNKEARMFVEPFLTQAATDKVISDMAVRFAKRDGGYTRIIKLGNRFFDNAPVVLMEWVEKSVVKTETPKKEKKSAKVKPSEKKTTSKKTPAKTAKPKTTKKETNK